MHRAMLRLNLCRLQNQAEIMKSWHPGIVAIQDFKRHAATKAGNGAPERTRTPNLLIRSQTLYPIELRARGRRMRANSSAEVGACSVSGGL